jgi:GST-like protein
MSLVLYTWTTPNGRKISIMLEDLGLPYEVRAVDIGRDEQFAPAFLKISPNNKIPALVDDASEGGSLAVFESGAILTYLPEKTGRFLAPSGAARYAAMEWLHWSIGGLGPMVGQLNFFALRSPGKAPLATDRFTREADRLLGVMDRRLGESAYLGGSDYSIADMAAYTWTFFASTSLDHVLADSLASKPAIYRWLQGRGRSSRGPSRHAGSAGRRRDPARDDRFAEASYRACRRGVRRASRPRAGGTLSADLLDRRSARVAARRATSTSRDLSTTALKVAQARAVASSSTWQVTKDRPYAEGSDAASARTTRPGRAAERRLH